MPHRPPRRSAWTYAALAGALAAGACGPGSSAETPGRRPPRAGPAEAAPARASAAPPAPAPTPTPTPPQVPDAVAERAARLGLGTPTTIVHLFVGPTPEAWVLEAGGPEPPSVLAWPLVGGHGLRGYGDGDGGGHRGIDIGAEAGAPILAAAEGLVGYAGHELSGYGNVVVIVHPAGWVTLYAHASALLARPGQIVSRGDAIARVGHTGNAQGDHLHFELRRDGHKVNPLPFLRGAPARMRPTEPLPLPRSPRVYRVKRSDRLWTIARGSGMTPTELAALNGLDPRDVLHVGHRLLIARPGGRSSVSPESAEDTDILRERSQPEMPNSVP